MKMLTRPNPGNFSQYIRKWWHIAISCIFTGLKRIFRFNR